MHISLCPIKDSLDFIPVINALKIQMLDGRTSDDKSIQLFPTFQHFREGPIETFHMFGRCIFAMMITHTNQGKLNL